MILAERADGDYHIYAGAIEAVQGDGYIAAVVVNLRHQAGRAAREAFRDDALACGHRWSSPESALSYAMGKGREAAERERRAPARWGGRIRREGDGADMELASSAGLTDEGDPLHRRLGAISF